MRAQFRLRASLSHGFLQREIRLIRPEQKAASAETLSACAMLRRQAIINLINCVICVTIARVPLICRFSLDAQRTSGFSEL